jgi:hypothetical protein
MEQKNKSRVNIIVCIITLAGFVSMLLINSNTYNVIIKDDIKNISKLTATNIYSDISIHLTKPIFVSLMSFAVIPSGGFWLAPMDKLCRLKNI